MEGHHQRKPIFYQPASYEHVVQKPRHFDKSHSPPLPPGGPPQPAACHTPRVLSLISAQSLNLRQLITPKWDDDSVEIGSKCKSSTSQQLSAATGNRRADQSAGGISVNESEFRDEVRDHMLAAGASGQRYGGIITTRQQDFKDMVRWQGQIRQI